MYVLPNLSKSLTTIAVVISVHYLCYFRRIMSASIAIHWIHECEYVRQSNILEQITV